MMINRTMSEQCVFDKTVSIGWVFDLNVVALTFGEGPNSRRSISNIVVRSCKLYIQDKY